MHVQFSVRAVCCCSDAQPSPGKDGAGAATAAASAAAATAAALSLHSTISFAFKGKHSSALPGQSIFNEEEAANRRKLNFPKRKKLAQKKAPGLSFVPKSDENEKAAEQAEQAEAAEAEELYPSQPTAADDARAAAAGATSKPHFKKMMFVQSSENLGGAAQPGNSAVGATSDPPAGTKPDLLKFIKVSWASQ